MNFYGAYGEAKTGTMDNYKRVTRPAGYRPKKAVPERGSKKKVEELDKDGNVVATFESVSQAAAECHIAAASMSQRIIYHYQVKGHTWRLAK